jgi:hypothetical protein
MSNGQPLEDQLGKLNMAERSEQQASNSMKPLTITTDVRA